MSHLISFGHKQYRSPANGKKVCIDVKITDASGNPLQNQIINLQTSLGTVNNHADGRLEVDALEFSSNSNGEVQCYFASDIEGTAMLTAKLSISGIEYIATASLVYSATLWDSVKYISNLSLTLNDGTSSTSIYGNGKHQAGVIVYCEALDDQRKYVQVSEEELLQHISLIDYTTGKELSTDSKNDWFYSSEENDFHTLATSSRASGSSASLFVMCGPETSVRTKSVAVQVNFTDKDGNPQVYSTDLHGTSGFNSYVYITALESISYNNGNNVSVLDTGYVDIKKDMTWETRSIWTNYKTRTGSKIRQKKVKIFPQSASKFHEVSMDFTGLKNNDVNRGSFTTWRNVEMDTFSVLDEQQQAAAVIGNGVNLDNYYCNIWMPAKNENINADVKLDGNVYVTKSSFQLMFQPTYEEKSGIYINDGSASFICYGLVIADDDYHQDGWGDTIGKVSVSVVDIYGNSGEFNVTWDDGDYFDTVHIY